MKKILLNISSIVLAFIAPVLGTLFHFITVYICAASFGFWTGFLSFCFPVISEILLFFDYVLSGNGFNGYCIIIYIYIFVLAGAFIVSKYIDED